MKAKGMPSQIIIYIFFLIFNFNLMILIDINY